MNRNQISSITSMSANKISPNRQNTYRIDNFSKSVLYYNNSKKKKDEYFIPVFLRLTLKKITEISVSQSIGKMAATIILSVYYKGIPDQILKIMASQISLTLNSQKNIDLKQNQNLKIQYNQKKFLITYIYRDVFDLDFNTNILFTPFQKIELSLTITIRSIQLIKDKNPEIKKNTRISFNLMDYPSKYDDFGVKLHLLNIGQSIGNYGFDKSSIKVRYGYDQNFQDNNHNKKDDQLDQQIKSLLIKDNIKIQQDDDKIKVWQSSRFQFQLFRYPVTDLITIFVPLWLLSLINLGIFFQDNVFSSRLSNLATLLVAYSAFFPTIRARIPPSPSITMIDLIVYSIISTSLLCFIRSFLNKQKTEQYNWQQDPIFLLCVAIDITTVIIILIGMSIHKFYEYFVFSKKIQRAGKFFLKFDARLWANQQCDNYFLSLKDRLNISVISHEEEYEDQTARKLNVIEL